MKKFFVLVVAAVFVLSVVGFCLAATDSFIVFGTVTGETKSSGNKVTVTVKDEKGKVQTITVNGQTPWKVGDKVVVKDGKIFSSDYWEHGPTTGGSNTHGPTSGGSR